MKEKKICHRIIEQVMLESTSGGDPIQTSALRRISLKIKSDFKAGFNFGLLQYLKFSSTLLEFSFQCLMISLQILFS